MKQKFIFVAGGVMSGVGKGIATASIGRILKEYGYKTTAIKVDPYINFDAGTLRPTEHGEVWVTEDGGEIDQDLGSYERFLGQELSRRNNITTGQVYSAIIERERGGKYGGKTVQFIPHVPQEIISRIKEAGDGYNIILTEIGGTIGDYENIPFLFAAKSLEREIGKENVVYVLITYLPVPHHINEMKTKPTQQAIKSLYQLGIFPDFILCRAHQSLDNIRKKKIETYANIETDYVISAPDVDNVYEVPLNFEREKLGKKILGKLHLNPLKKSDWGEWKKLVKSINHPKKEIDIAMIGKYVDIGAFTLKDSYISVNEALRHAGATLNVGINIHWIDAKEIEENGTEILKNFRGIVVPGGFGLSGVEGKITAIKYARENNIPYLGLCFGMQLAVVEFARNVLGFSNAHTTEVDPKNRNPVIFLMPSQREILKESRYGATMRLGAYSAILRKNTLVYRLYKESGRISSDMKKAKDIKEKFRLGKIREGDEFVLERHRHRYEVNPQFISKFEKKGLIFSGMHRSINGEKLMEFIEIPEHRFFVATQAHPEFKSSLCHPSPLFLGFVRESAK